MEEKKLTVTFVNVGYGEAILLESPDPSKPDGVFTALIDGGSAEDSEFADRSSGRVRIEEYLEKRGTRRLDLAVSTHIHEDHLCGLLRAARITPPAVLWQTLPPDLYRSLRPLDGSVARNLSESKFMQALNDYGTLCALVEDHGGTILAPKSGQELVIAPDLTVQILSPSTKKQLALADEINALYNSANVCSTFLQRLDALDARMNNYSLILRLNYRGTRILLPGDTNVTGYDGIDPADLRADLFKGTPRTKRRRRRSAGRIDPSHRCGLLRVQRPPLQQRPSGHHEAAGRSWGSPVFFRLSPGPRYADPAP